MLEYRAVIEDGAVAMLRFSPRETRVRRAPQILGEWIAALRSLASALDATVLDAQVGIPLGADDDDDVPAPASADDFVIERLPASGRTAVLERCATINGGDGWVAYDPAREDVFPLDWFLEPA